MNTRIRYLLVGFLCLYFIDRVSAQTSYRLGGIASFNLNDKLAGDWSYNVKIESRQSVQTGTINGDFERGLSLVNTDFSLVSAKKVFLNSRIAAGYLFRLREGEKVHRFIQQYTVVQRVTGYRMAHRFMGDQSFASEQSPEFRIRYRISSEIPLSGEALDSKEFYLKINNEYLNRWQGYEYDLEIRLVPLLGYDIGGDKKIEAGLDYRVDSWLKGEARHNFWVITSLFIEI